ncbi:MAG: TetR/AcrR family transcriptional regulator [Alphaproteobacteria bacterium]|nr:TetR/AcrR family transcriptional regulator [Alphaproteobacteria bacterium]
MTTEAGPSASTRERILEVAIPLFAEHGFAGTSVRMVGQGASVNVATLAYHFDDKEGLYRACIERLYEDLSALDVPPPGPGVDPLADFVRTAWAYVRSRRTHVRLLHRHLLDRGHHHEAFRTRWMTPLLHAADPLFDGLRPDLDDTGRRLILFTSMHLLVRFVLDDPADLADSLQVDLDDLDATMVRWLTHLVRAQLAVP